ncbi:gamma-glutamylcyclotransferase [Jiella sp. MQZ9-1]|uniref:Gamma-glutamylcyclotransferase n=1 Tax=Jiella flava TaxID=2816857 RepID=A0A939JSN1_9HYPH|nr:gamma-glutamylcyclotransferase family protein [Jiella flava]MBO0661265.1 gamma-glutamylcyclotransferase [Jiella flava]MCD2469910.1 gamma-glutamylcyclotransferase [Jiella flava]
MTEYFAFYGTLMDDAGNADTPSTEGLVRRIGPCRLHGELRSHGAYPGFFLREAGDGQAFSETVIAELHEILRPEAFAVFDAWENYDPADEPRSMYLRRRITLAEPEGIEAWIYLSQLSREDPLVPGGDWRAYRRQKVRPSG